VGRTPRAPRVVSGTPDDQGAVAVAAACRVLDYDERGYALHPWQIAYLFALVEGRPPVVPPGCGVGRGWLDRKLAEVLVSGESESLC